MTLHNIGVLYRDTERTQEAEDAYREAISIRRSLAEAHPEANSPELAQTLNNLAFLYSEAKRPEEASKLSKEASDILHPLWLKHPAVHGDQMARILFLRSTLSRPSDPVEALALARQALAAALDPDLKQLARSEIDSFPVAKHESGSRRLR
jgi:tetratricopeptide (TPR) repeat protein